MKRPVPVFLAAFALAAILAGCDEGAEKSAPSAVAEVDQNLQQIAKEAEASSEALDKHLPSIIDSIKKILGIAQKEAEKVKTELDKIPQELEKDATK
ncbi:MAG TPA: hypothetical protein PLV09_01115 [Candidatus Omnitrophota bacterium]|nr:hypothetical protein [Candidatus Omnitrophota bacterium]MDD5738020.1 hypothetical protein [Candidatus Omnitrophota bacterium]HOX09672.1 hypothetical protein [Candidatus Omnitrophota bacterium]HPN66000.1 hypothetical protein [Candidatus Omnitrophota bacterium]HRZ66925.1 hypothetical protein [Candidatus Omnitrophota bacterium]